MPAVYDNPDTQCREIYVHGHLVTYFEADKLARDYYGARTPVQEQFMEVAQRCGPFTEGIIHYGEEHMPFDPLATNLHPDDEEFKLK